MRENFEIYRFMTALAEVRSVFRDIHILMEKMKCFSRVSTEVIPFSGRIEYSDVKNASINFTVNGEFINWNDVNKKAFGASLMIFCADGKWTLECEYGWSGQYVGWDAIYASVVEYQTADDLVASLQLAATDFRSAVIQGLEAVKRTV